jgi:hypothetical protein
MVSFARADMFLEELGVLNYMGLVFIAHCAVFDRFWKFSETDPQRLVWKFPAVVKGLILRPLVFAITTAPCMIFFDLNMSP